MEKMQKRGWSKWGDEFKDNSSQLFSKRHTDQMAVVYMFFFLILKKKNLCVYVVKKKRVCFK